ncbi:hypothetical protein TNCV_3467441 [Trichonephila clavipes]|nr:hypothetical protein TNCV_3467441 [Trichonephila clavipes]
MPDASEYTRSTCSLNQWVRKSCGLNHEGRGLKNISVPCLNCGCGDRWCRHLSSLRGILPRLIGTVTYMMLKANDSVLLAPCHDEFYGPRSDYVRQVA